jgi:hypothetical protein
LGDGNDTYLFQNGTNTLIAGNGNDSVDVHEGDSSIHLGNGNDTVHLFHGGRANVVLGHGTDSVTISSGGADTLHIGSHLGTDTIGVFGASADIFIGHGKDSLHAVGGRYEAHLSGGSDTVEVSSFHGSVDVGGTHNHIRVANGAFTLITDAGFDTITVTGSYALLAHGKGHDSVNIWDSGTVSVAGGFDTIHMRRFQGNLTANGNHDSIYTTTGATALVTANGGHDTLALGGSIKLNAVGNDDLIIHNDDSGFFNGPNAHSIKNVIVDAGNHDTYQYNYNDDAHEGPPGGIADSPGIGTLTISDFHKKTDVLRFHDTGGDSFNGSELNSKVTVVDHGVAKSGVHRAVDVIIHTIGGHTAGSIVLDHLGTKHGLLNSLDALAHAGFHLEFT